MKKKLSFYANFYLDLVLRHRQLKNHSVNYSLLLLIAGTDNSSTNTAEKIEEAYLTI